MSDSRPHNKPEVDERQLRRDLVTIYGEESEHIAKLDEIFHRMWAAEDEVERLKAEAAAYGWGATG